VGIKSIGASRQPFPGAWPMLGPSVEHRTTAAGLRVRPVRLQNLGRREVPHICQRRAAAEHGVLRIGFDVEEPERHQVQPSCGIAASRHQDPTAWPRESGDHKSAG
jgi:hypothetical protein